MIIDNNIKKAVFNNVNISSIYKGSDIAWKKEPTTSVMMKGVDFNSLNLLTSNKANIQSFKLAPKDITTPEIGTVDISEAQNGTIIMWYDNNTATLYYKPVGVDIVIPNQSCWNMFRGLSSLKEVPLLDTSNVTSMCGMFYGTSLTTIPRLDTSKVTDMSNMFSNCSSLTTIPLLDTSKVTNINNIFRECISLTTIPLLDTSNVTDMMSMFYGCTKLTSIPELDTSKVTRMRSMFNSCNGLINLDISWFNTSNVTDMLEMFHGCSSLVSIKYGDKFVNDNCTNFNNMYQNCPANKPNWTNGTWDANGTFIKK